MIPNAWYYDIFESIPKTNLINYEKSQEQKSSKSVS